MNQVTSNSEVVSIKEISLNFLSEKAIVRVLKVFFFLLFVTIISSDEEQIFIIFVHFAEASEFQGKINLLGTPIATEERISNDLGRNNLVVS